MIFLVVLIAGVFLVSKARQQSQTSQPVQGEEARALHPVDFFGGARGLHPNIAARGAPLYANQSPVFGPVFLGKPPIIQGPQTSTSGGGGTSGSVGVGGTGSGGGGFSGPSTEGRFLTL